MKFESKFEHKGSILLPRFSGTRIMMMPILLGNPTSVPETLAPYRQMLSELFGMVEARHVGHVGYLTIDEKRVRAGETHRRSGLHVDGIYQGSSGPWGGGDGGGGWGGGGTQDSTGMLTLSSLAGCRAYLQSFVGEIGAEGECDHLADQCRPEHAFTFEPHQVYWVHGLCVHESLPLPQDSERQFVRLSMPSTSPWFEGYTENPLGVKPTGPILSPRSFMQEAG